MVFNATFNNISAILWRSVLLVEETGVPEEIHYTEKSKLGRGRRGRGRGRMVVGYTTNYGISTYYF
jgi:hypothetical protein